MAPNAKVTKALKAMKQYDIAEKTVKPVLKKLLDLYDNNWDYIEDENYRLLLDAIFDNENAKNEESTKKKFRLQDEPEEYEQPLKKKRLRSQSDQPSSHVGPLILQNMEEELPRDALPMTNNQLVYQSEELLESKQSDDELPEYKLPLVVILPAHASTLNEDDLSYRRHSDVNKDDQKFDMRYPSSSYQDDSSHAHYSEAKEQNANCLELIHVVDAEDKWDKDDHSPSQIDLASSSKGEVNIYATCNSSILRISNLDAVFKAVEEKFLKSYGVTDPSFSLLKVMKDLCECFLDIGTVPTDYDHVSPLNVPLTCFKKTSCQKAVSSNRSAKTAEFCFPSNLSNESIKYQNFIEVQPHIPRFRVSDGLEFIINLERKEGEYTGQNKKTNTIENCGIIKSRNMEIVQKQSTFLGPVSVCYYVDDITRGEEMNKISIVNENNDECLPIFTYISRNVTYQNAYVKFVLARISEENCCSNCVGECTSLEIPCACAAETGGEFAYTPGGVVKEEFLQKCTLRNPDSRKNLFYCKDCPLQRSEDNRFSGSCYGHIVRKFIKECWCKCGCSKSCGNRVVQRGITVNLQVFMTPEGKGWGLRTLEDLPKGAFICEYVGEIVTNTELYERNKQKTGDKHTYPVLLDADWGSEGVLKDEEALCLDATSYGNVARFINHRCCDANMVEIPVEVETPDHHYYHLAFFTSRKVNAYEELTWDYGIDFGDTTHPVKAFQCLCGSNFCKGSNG